MRVVVDSRRCQGHGRCYDLAPDVFEPDERGHVGMALQGNLPALLEPDTRIGVHNCPESALRLVSDAVEGLSNHSHHAELAEQPLSKLIGAETTG